MKNRNRTDSYYFTVDMKNGKPVGDYGKLVTDLRKYIAECNKFQDTKQYVKLQGRLGKNNTNSEKYKHKYTGYQCISLKDAKTADVYVYVR